VCEIKLQKGVDPTQRRTYMPLTDAALPVLQTGSDRYGRQQKRTTGPPV
jgi:hypothetical protein